MERVWPYRDLHKGEEHPNNLLTKEERYARRMKEQQRRKSVGLIGVMATGKGHRTELPVGTVIERGPTRVAYGYRKSQPRIKGARQSKEYMDLNTAARYVREARLANEATENPKWRYGAGLMRALP